MCHHCVKRCADNPSSAARLVLIRVIAETLTQKLRDVLDPLLREIESLNELIAEYDWRIEPFAKDVDPEVALLQ